MGMCMRGRNRRLLPMDRAAIPNASTQASQVPERHTPSSLNEQPRFRNSSQSAPTNDHSWTKPAHAQSQNRSSAVPRSAAGMDDVISLETAQMTAGAPKARIADFNPASEPSGRRADRGDGCGHDDLAL